MTTLVIAEKPSVARDIAQVLGARGREDGYLRGPRHLVTWAIGHLVTLAEPHEMNPAWKKWRLQDLPLLPPSWPLVVSQTTRDQFEVVRKLLVSREVSDVVCATDAGREGELIFRYIYEAAGARKPIQRLWISSLTPDAIAEGFRKLRAGSAFDALADAARGRSRADWLVGMNLSRAYSLLNDDNLSVGRVQTPTLAMVVAREQEITAFVPEDYLEVVATFEPRPGAAQGPKEPQARAAADAQDPERGAVSYTGTYTRPEAKGREARRLAPDGEEAAKIVERARRGAAQIESVERETRRLPPPLLYDLTELQRHANRIYGFTAQRTLDIAQALYERWKLISYPRTDSRHLSGAVAATLPAIVEAISAPYRPLLAEGTGERPLGRRFVDDAKVTDHHAILPTEAQPPESLPDDERKIHDLVCRRLLSSWHGDHVYAVTTVVTAITTDEAKDRYASSGTSIEVVAWKALDPKPRQEPRDRARAPQEPTLPGGLQRGMPQRVLEAKPVTRRTRPPPRFSDGTLLTAMETAGRTLDEKEISDAMREKGLGTPATRAAILETLLRRQYVVREGKVLQATPKGIALIEAVHPHVKSPAMTGEWEAKLARIERGEGRLDAFMREIEDYVRQVVGTVAGGAPLRSPSAIAQGSYVRTPTPPSVNTGVYSPTPPPVTQGAYSRTPSPPSVTQGAHSQARVPPSVTPGAYSQAAAVTARPARPARSSDLGTLLRDAFKLPSFRPYQEIVCREVASGKDVLLVMPTGAGKSLCYQLPGLARGGTTLVVSPLIALMEDQVAKLVQLGFAAERIHSGRGRPESRSVCKAYLEGALDFLFVAPERLGVPGFPEMLARRTPALIAIDEAHCISQWGHDFRPDYRMLGERLPLLRPAPVIALTATATPAVQDDIIQELRLPSPVRFIHGFRRTNIGVEVVERNPSDRATLVRELLIDPARRPAIVYAPTRKDSEAIARALSPGLRAEAYHAGLGAGVRDEVQSAFLGSAIDIIVATTAFGMGIDKADVRTVIHTALPATLEGYYQEIGRAGRDGAPSRAVLIHSFVDTKTHEFFLDRDYPEADVLGRLQAVLGQEPMAIADLSRRANIPPPECEKALEKLWIHGGALVDPDETVRRGTANWRPTYERQREHKRRQLEKMRRYAETPTCRMLQLVAHFGDQNDSGAPCGTCDVCKPSSCMAQLFRAPTAEEQSATQQILGALRARDGRAVGQMHRELFEGSSIDRKALEHILGALVRAGDVEIVADEFVKDGGTITFQRVFLTPSAKRGACSADLRFVVIPPRPAKSARTKRTRTPKGGVRAKADPGVVRALREPITSEDEPPLASTLRAWRQAEARKRGVPAFRILTDRTLLGIAMARPSDEAELLEVAGMGPSALKKYGRALLSIVSPSRE